MTLMPGEVGSGIIFKRTDAVTGRSMVPAIWDHVVGTTLCTYLRALADDQQAVPDIVSAHLKAMDTILENRILGEGGDEGQALISRLSEITAA